MAVRVLVTNDDGIHSPGLRALVEVIAQGAEAYVVAPEHQRSATGHAITLHKPLRAFPVTIPAAVSAWAANGTPADCVALGVLDLLGFRPDVIVSGINAGANLGREITYSGTVSGAMEGAIFGIPALAVSVDAFEHVRYDVAAAFASDLVRLIAERGLPPDALLNVNVPNLPREAIRGVAITRLGRGRYLSKLEKRLDPRGQAYYWRTGQPSAEEEDPGSDGYALRHGYISVTPVQMDMTHEPLLAALRAWEIRLGSSTHRG